MNLSKLFPDLTRLKPAYYQDEVTPKARTGGKDERNKTQKGATHIVGAHFRPRRVTKYTCAAYRRNHAGKVTIVPNYLKPHPKPKGRNLVKGV